MKGTDIETPATHRAIPALSEGAGAIAHLGVVSVAENGAETIVVRVP